MGVSVTYDYFHICLSLNKLAYMSVYCLAGRCQSAAIFAESTALMENPPKLTQFLRRTTVPVGRT